MDDVILSMLGDPHPLWAEKVADIKPEVVTFAGKKFENQSFRNHKRVDFDDVCSKDPYESIEHVKI